VVWLRAWFPAACAATFLLLPSAYADTVIDFTLNVDGCTGGCGSNGKNSTNNNFATIQLDDNGLGSVIVTETLHGTEFVNSSGKEALVFNLPVLTGLTITLSDPSSFAVSTARTYSMSPFSGSFDEAIKCTVCGNGSSHPEAGPLIFTVTAAGGVTASDFHVTTGGYYFASDVIGVTSGKTGDVASNSAGTLVSQGAQQIPATPEPGTVLSALGGVSLLGLFLKTQTRLKPRRN